MSRTARIISVILLCVLMVIAAFLGVYSDRLMTVSSIRKITGYGDGYNIYSMDVKYDYSIQDIIDSGIDSTQGFVDAVIKESLPLLPVRMKLPSFGCSTYRAVTDGGDTIMGRNYDFMLNTSCMVVHCRPQGGYESLACVALNNISADDPFADIKSEMACLAAPFSCLDGVNEKGVSVAVLTLDSLPTDQRNSREKITHSLAIRMILDWCATTQEAVDLLAKYDMFAVNGRDYHLFVSDASGDSRVIENDCEDLARPMVATPAEAITNFYAMYADKVVSGQRNGIYGHGKERYDRMMEVIQPCGGILNRENAWAALQAAATEPNPDNVTSNTQWSIIFNNSRPSADIVLRRNWDDIYHFGM